MKIFNAKSLSQIKREQADEIPPVMLEMYEIIAEMGEELLEVAAENKALREEVETLKGGAK